MAKKKLPTLSEALHQYADAHKGQLIESAIRAQAEKESVREQVGDAVFILVNAMAEKYPLGCDFGRYEGQIRTLIQFAQDQIEAA